ncbi:MAG: glycosyltransferase [Chthoniobacteraceae bacterium]|jgi:glycosyltransferase involved in cell wall biosynthesis
MMHDLIFVSLENWDDVWRRNQFLCASLARRFPAMKILFVGLPRNVSHDLRHGSLRALNTGATWTVPSHPNITVTHALKLCPDSIASGRRINEAMARGHIRRVARGMGMTRSLLWLNPHSAVHMAGAMGEKAVIYDITDDWTEAPSFPAWQRKLIARQDRALCARADLVIVCSEALEASRRAHSKRILLLPNGVDCEHYAAIAGSVEESRWPRPVLGYTGTVHGDRFDVDLVAGLARKFAQGSVVLVGPDHLTPAQKAKLEPLPNVHITGPVPYGRIPETMAQFDVCIVPHVETPFTNSLNPLKLWEYLAAGKPIVSTNVAGFRNYPDLCRIASGVEPFAEACRQALDERGATGAQRKAEARKHSWTRRIDTLLDGMGSAGLIAPVSAAA